MEALDAHRAAAGESRWEPQPEPLESQPERQPAPRRRILHCDMDCFYAAVHMRDDPSLRGLPVVIGGSPSGRGVVAAASYEARQYGIRSAMPAARAVKLCRHAVFLKPEFPRYRKESEAIFAILREFTPVVQPASLDEAYLDVSDELAPDRTATEIARAIRKRVFEERHLTISVGVGPNKLIAKLASDHRKPDGLTVVRPHQVTAFLDPLPVRRLPGVGPATERSLRDLGFETVADLRAISTEDLEARFGKHGRGLARYARGIDDRPVRVERERKSLGHERTYREDLPDLPAMDAEITRLASMVAKGLQRRDLGARTVSVKVRYPDFTTLTRSRTFAEPIASAQWIDRIGRELLRQTDAGRVPVRLLGVTASGLVEHAPLQLWLFDSPSDGRTSNGGSLD